MSNFFQTALKAIETVPGELASFFTTHQSSIHNAIADAQVGLTLVTGIAATVESPAAASALAMEIGKISAGLNLAGAAATAAATSSSLTQQLGNVAALTNGLVASGDINVKSPKTQAAVAAAVAKVQTVIGTLATAAAAVSGAIPAVA